ncbi:MAG TPA: HEAT repeat domain-containing protein [Vicinamibacterales bacterium]|nr:HEAT repeat domain-containing protein [Vicinamibacterales bacterium]
MRRPAAVLAVLLSLSAPLSARSWQSATAAPAQGKDPGDAVTRAQLAAAIEQLGSVEFPVRMHASRTVRRAAPALAIPALRQAARGHADGYVRYRALVLLSGFNDPATRELMIEALAEKNDRLRAVAYAYFEDHPDKGVLPRLLEALGKEESEFVRPALTRALAAFGAQPEARQAMTGLVMKGQAFFRSVVIEALGDYRASYALKPLLEVVAIEGPLQDDAALALGKIGDKAALPALAALQRTAPREAQPAIAGAICLLGVNCSSHERFVVESLRFGIDQPAFQELLRGSATALAALAAAGRQDAAVELVVQGAPTRDPARAAIALALGTVALRNTPVMLDVLGREALLAPGVELLREAFDMLEEDYEEERFFVTVRRAFWQAPAGSPARRVAETLVRQLEF